MEKRPWDYGPLRVSGNGRYLQNGETPFFWLADTAWPLFHRLGRADARLYLKNRAEKGFNVIQSVLAFRADGVDQGTSELERPEYWEKCDAIVDMAEELGLYMALLPCWGSYVRDGLVDEAGALRYADFLASRYAGRRNIIWLLGGDIRGSEAPALYNAMGRRMRALFPDFLIGYHPFGRTSSSLWFHAEPWLDFNMFQSGHRRYDQTRMSAWDDAVKAETAYGEDNWRYVEHDRALTPQKPTVDGEPSYEQIVQGLHDPTQPVWRAPEVRRYAWWSVLAGAMGHTYGHNAIMQFYEKGRDGAYCVRHDWREAIHHEGGGQMRFLKDLMLSVDFINGRPNDRRLTYGQRERHNRISVFEGPGYIFCYDYTGAPFALDLEDLAGRGPEARWLDPATGLFSLIGPLEAGRETIFTPPEKFSNSSDWALVLSFSKDL